MNNSEKEIGRILGMYSGHEIDLLTASSLIQEQLELIKLEHWKKGMTDAANIVIPEGVTTISLTPAEALVEAWTKINTARDSKEL